MVIKKNKSPKKYRMQRILNIGNDKHVTDINYKIEPRMKLIPERIFDKGILKQVNYYNMYNDENKLVDKNLILRVRMFYERDSNGNAVSRTTYREYVLNNNNPNILEFGITKVTIKRYDTLASIKEGIRRRSNIYDFSYGMMATLPSSVRIKVAEYLEAYRIKFINLGLPINLGEIKDLDPWFGTADGATKLEIFKRHVATPISDVIPPIGGQNEF